jgi:hypothetical protein
MTRAPGRWGLIGTLAGAIALSASPAWACQLGTPAPASPESRLFNSDRYGLSLEIPANYRSVLRNTGDITFHDPVSFVYVQCLVSRGRYGRPPLHPLLEVSPVADERLDLVELVRRRRPWVDFYQPTFEATTVDGQPAVRYEYVQEISGVPMVNLSFLSRDARQLITLAGPANRVTEQAIASLAFLPN